MTEYIIDTLVILFSLEIVVFLLFITKYDYFSYAYR